MRCRHSLHWTGPLVLVMVAGVLSGCTDAAGPTPEDPDRQRIIAMGFRPDMIVDRGSYWLVEGDIAIPKAGAGATVDDLPGPRNRWAPMFQYRTTNIVGHGQSQNVRVVISPSLESGWAQATRQAMTEWSSISGVVVRFVESGPADITVSHLSLPYDYIAEAQFPVGSPSWKPGTWIHIDPEFNYYSASQKKFIMAHEFGHNIGFRHTNWSARGEGASPWGAIQIGFTTTEGNSVMNGGTGGNNWIGFSFWDMDATRIIYPMLPVISVVDQGAGNPYLVSWTPVPNAVSYNVTLCWTVTDEYEGQFYQYGACTPWHSGLGTSTTFPNIGSDTCWPFFVLKVGYQYGSALYGQERNVNTGCQ